MNSVRVRRSRSFEGREDRLDQSTVAASTASVTGIVLDDPVAPSESPPSSNPFARSTDVLVWFALCFAFTVGATPSLRALTITEVYYHPTRAEGRSVEYIELTESGPLAVDVSGFELTGGVRFRFPDGAMVPAGGSLIVAADRDALLDAFAIDSRRVYGDFAGFLDNGRESVVLVDANHAYVDRVLYDDEAPWPASADGDGDALHRVCLESDGMLSGSWVGAAPSPLAPGPAPQCPPPEPSLGAVVFTEIHYHPPRAEGVILPVGDDGEAEEFLELHNRLDAPVDVSGWSISTGVDYTFPDGLVLAPGDHAVLTRDAGALRAHPDVSEATFVGEYEGRLSNGGERVTLVDADGNRVDSVRYDDFGDWPYAADGERRSLERVHVDLPSEDPANWRSSRVVPGEFRTIVAEGFRSTGLAQTFVLSLDGVGEVIVDDIVFRELDEDGVEIGPNLLFNPDFDSGRSTWTTRGNAADSTWDETAGVGGTGAIRLVSSGPCPLGECGTGNGMSTSPLAALRDEVRYRISVAVKPVSGSFRFSAGIHLGVTAVATEQIISPGRSNTVSAAGLAPFVDHVGRFPLEPTSADETWISAHVRGEADDVVLRFASGESGDFTPVAMADDGRHRDGGAGDGVYGAMLPAFPHGTQVRWWIEATNAFGSRDYPPLLDGGAPDSRELRGYYVFDPSETDLASGLPAYHVLLEGIDGSNAESVNDHLDCAVLKRGSFAYRGELYPDVGVRWRGNTACRVLKRNFKIRFNKAYRFDGRRKLNLNGLWTDKALVREFLAWEFVDQIGLPAVATEYIRLNVSGSYYGLFLSLEHPDEEYLDRTGLDSRGSLYKAKQPDTGDIPGVPRLPPGGFSERWEEETNEGSDYSDIEEFVTAMHDDASTPEGPTLEFWETSSLPEQIIGFQLTQVVLNNFDASLKNHFLYHDLGADRWGFLPWDLDLVMGKFFTFQAVGPGRPVGTLNDILAGDLGPLAQMGPFYFTSIGSNNRSNWLLDLFFRAGDGHYQRSYLVRLWNILEEKFRASAYLVRMGELAEWLVDEQAEDFDRWGRYPSNVEGYPADMLSNIDIAIEQVDLHARFLRQTISDEYPDVLRTGRLIFTELMYLPAGGDSDLEFLELVNVFGREIDIGGWSIDGVGFTFDDGTVIPDGGVVVVARSPDDLTAALGGVPPELLFGPYDGRLANEGEELRLLDAGAGYRATIDRVEYDSSGAWPDLRPGSSLSLGQINASVDNDDPRAWKVSVGGSPGLSSLFLRGDTDADFNVNLADAVYLLQYLFVDGEPPLCPDAADSDDDGRMAINDAIFTLNFLFADGDPIPAPYPLPGGDPTPDSLGCF